VCVCVLVRASVCVCFEGAQLLSQVLSIAAGATSLTIPCVMASQSARLQVSTGLADGLDMGSSRGRQGGRTQHHGPGGAVLYVRVQQHPLPLCLLREQRHHVGKGRGRGTGPADASRAMHAALSDKAKPTLNDSRVHGLAGWLAPDGGGARA
jgi:hypothetical protein